MKSELIDKTQRKTSESLTGMEPMASGTLCGRSIHWATSIHGEQGEQKICPCIHQGYAWWCINSKVTSDCVIKMHIVNWTMFGHKWYTSTSLYQIAKIEKFGNCRCRKTCKFCYGMHLCLYRLCQGHVHHGVKMLNLWFSLFAWKGRDHSIYEISVFYSNSTVGWWFLCI